MLSRRNLRVKVMQVLYAMEHIDSTSTAEAIKLLEKSITRSYNLFFFNLALLVRIADYIRKESGIKSSKLLPTADDLSFSTRLANHPLVSVLRSDKRVGELLRLTMNDEDLMLVKELFKKLSDEEEYKLYCTGQADENKIISVLFNEVVMKSPSYVTYVEDNFSECITELNKVNFAVTEVFQKLNVSNGSGLELPNSDAEVAFAKDLIEKTLTNNDQYTALIQPKLKNWDLDRIARLDMILMKMALCELLCFEQIPIKVSINEYIDISKTFSTPRSKDFINGILDSIMHELRDKNEIKKTGRGLVE